MMAGRPKWRRGQQHRVVAAALFSFLSVATSASAHNTFPSNGNVGIGTTSPNTALEITGADPGQSNTLGLRVDNITGYSVGMFVGQNRGVFGSTNMTPVDFISNGILPKMTLSTDGNLGIGTTAPISRLNISGADPGTGSVLLGVRVENASGFNAGIGVAGNRATIGATN